jgi:hypothetical protein
MDHVTVRLPETVLVQELEGEFVMLELRGGRYFGLDQVGTSMLRALLENPTVEDSIARLLDEFEVDEATLRGDLQQLISRLTSEGLVVVQSAQSR